MAAVMIDRTGDDNRRRCNIATWRRPAAVDCHAPGTRSFRLRLALRVAIHEHMGRVLDVVLQQVYARVAVSRQNRVEQPAVLGRQITIRLVAVRQRPASVQLRLVAQPRWYQAQASIG